MKTAYWLELLADSGILPAKRLTEIRKAADELIAIFTTCVRNVKRKKGNK
jgi:hypothetical protein